MACNPKLSAPLPGKFPDKIDANIPPFVMYSLNRKNLPIWFKYSYLVQFSMLAKCLNFISLQVWTWRNRLLQSSQLNRYSARFGCERLRGRVPSVPMLLWKLRVLEIPLDKKLTANCLVETRTSWSQLRWLNMVWIGYSSPCGWSSPWLMVSYGMDCLGP